MAKRYKVSVQKYLYEFHYYEITEMAIDCSELPGRNELEFDKFVDAAECAYKILRENPVIVLQSQDDRPTVRRTVAIVFDREKARSIERNYKRSTFCPFKPSAATTFENITAEAARTLVDHAHLNS
jgi:hypothetical protein|nr:MAG TPA: hypothetical protein [Bacteriophage sp.]